MKSKTILMLVVLFLAAAGLPNGLYAAGEVTIEIGGTVCKTGAPPLNIASANLAALCPSLPITLAPIGTGNARIELTPATDDKTVDSLRLVNTRITANQPVSDYHIKFYRTHTEGPNNPPGPIYYKTTAYGTFNPYDLRIAGNSIFYNQYVTNPAAGTPTLLGSPPNWPQTYSVYKDGGDNLYPSFNLTPTGVQWTAGISGDRVLTVDFWITLQTTGDSLNLSGSGMKIASAGAPDLTCPSCPPWPWFCLILALGAIGAAWFIRRKRRA